MRVEDWKNFKKVYIQGMILGFDIEIYMYVSKDSFKNHV